MDHIEAALAAFGFKATKGGFIVAVGGWLFSSAAAAWFGALVAFGGFLMTWHFNRKRDKREQMEHEARMKEMRDAAH